MCFHLRLQPLTMQKGSFAGNKAQWIRFKGLEGDTLESSIFMPQTWLV